MVVTFVKGWVLFRLGNTSPLEFFQKVTREVRSLLLSDLGNSFPLQTVFVSLFCLFCSCGKKNPPLQSALLLNLGIQTGVPQVSEYQKVNTARTAEVTITKVKTARIAGDDQ